MFALQCSKSKQCTVSGGYDHMLVSRGYMRAPPPPRPKDHICTDSSLVHLSATGKARKWALDNWVGPRGPLSNVSLWKDILHELDSLHRTVKWIKVPFHEGIQGNEEADSLAEDGQLSSPLLRQSVAPQTRNLRCSLAPQRGAGLPPLPEPTSISDSNSESATSEPPPHHHHTPAMSRTSSSKTHWPRQWLPVP